MRLYKRNVDGSEKDLLGEIDRGAACPPEQFFRLSPKGGIQYDLISEDSSLKMVWNIIENDYKSHENEEACYCLSYSGEVKYSIFVLPGKVSGEASSGSVPSFYFMDHDQILGEGGDGKVYLAFELNEKAVSKAVVKYCQYDFLDNDKKNDLQNEIRGLGDNFFCRVDLKNMSHANQTVETYLVMRHKGINLEQYLYETIEGCSFKKNIPIKKQLQLFQMMISRYLASIVGNNLFHKDIKPGNFTLQIIEDEIAGCDFIDWSRSRPADQIDRERPDSFGYVAPEIVSAINNKTPWQYTAKNDIYALGVTLTQILSEHCYPERLTMTQKEIEDKEHHKRDLWHTEISQLMPDILGDGSQKNVIAQNTTFLELYKIARHCAAENPKDRAELKKLKEYLGILNQLLKKSSVSEETDLRKRQSDPVISPRDNSFGQVVRELEVKLKITSSEKLAGSSASGDRRPRSRTLSLKSASLQPRKFGAQNSSTPGSPRKNHATVEQQGLLLPLHALTNTVRKRVNTTGNTPLPRSKSSENISKNTTINNKRKGSSVTPR